MEKLPKQEVVSLVEQKRVEALASVLDELDTRLPIQLKSSFESNGREYALTPVAC